MHTSTPVRLLSGVALLLSLAACGGRDATADEALSRDLQLASHTSVTEVSLGDTAGSTAAPPPAAPTPRPPTRTQPPPAAPRPAPAAPAPAAPTTGTVHAGARMLLASSERICTNTHRVGERFEATLRDGVFGSNGAVIPAGSRAEVEIVELKRSENMNDEIVIRLAVRSVAVEGRRYEVEADVKELAVERVRNSNDAKKVVGGAVVGAVVGQVIGRDTRSTVIGAATGAAAGTAAAAATANHEGCVPQDGRIEVVLSSPLSIHLVS